MAEPQFLDLPGCTLAWWAIKPPAGDTTSWIVCVHGAAVDHHEFDHQYEALAERANVLTFDIRGHGASTLKRGATVRFDDVIADLTALMNHIGIGRATLLGHSFGGDVAQEFASRFPDRMDALITVGSPGVQRDGRRKERLRTYLTIPVIFLTPWSRFVALSARVTSKKPEIQAYVADCMMGFSRYSFVTMGRTRTDSLRPVESSERPLPTLLVRGEHDMPTLLDPIYASLTAANPRAKIAIVPDAGHQCMQEQPGRFNAIVSTFLSTLQY